MEFDKGWGRVKKMKQESLPLRANDHCGGIEWDRHPAWTDAMREALKTRQESKGKWFSLIDRMWDRRHLQSAWDRIEKRVIGEARKRGAGVDGVTVEKFGQQAASEIDRLAEELKSGTYRPRPVRRHYIPKPGTTKKRPLGLPCVRDKVVQEALRSLMEPIFETEFLEGSHGFRGKRSTDTACQQLERYLQAGKGWVVDSDILGFFDNLDQERALAEVNRRIADGKVLKLIRSFLEAGVMEEMKVRHTTTGTPQGGIVSPLLANIYLHAMDEELEARHISWVRYADDFLLVCATREEAEAALEAVRGILKGMKLELSPEKTHIRHLDEGFDFLGWHYQGQRRWPRKKSVKGLRLKMREKTRRLRPGSMEQICAEVSPMLRGWYNYFRDGNSGLTFGDISSWVRRRLRSILNRRHKGKGIGKLNLNFRWPNAFFRDRGLFDPEVALQTYRRQSYYPLT
ncbi:MAG: group II intron reverse transcriptase/maturase [Dehalococcoidia bacterium]|nr:group II intron reverse transcriptase/maturase [Dehalococcoidia bacterium]